MKNKKWTIIITITLEFSLRFCKVRNNDKHRIGSASRVSHKVTVVNRGTGFNLTHGINSLPRFPRPPTPFLLINLGKLDSHSK